MPPRKSRTEPPVNQQVVVTRRLEELHFDPLNPRLPETIDGSDEEDVLGWMLDDASLADLVGSIAAQGYFPGEPLLVVPRKKGGGYTVVEGNRRLAALKLLVNPARAPKRQHTVAEIAANAVHKPELAPTLEFPERDAILEYLGYRHITGVKEWEPLAKARYAYQLWGRTTGASDAARFRKLATTIGSGKRADYVARLITAFMLYQRVEDESFFELQGVGPETINFSFFLVALNHSSVVRFLGLKSSQDPTLKGLTKRHLKELVDWMFRVRDNGATLLGESRNMRLLGRVVDNERALAALRAGEPLVSAVTLTGEPNDIFADEVREGRDNLATAQSQQHLVTEVREATKAQLREIQKLATVLLKVMDDLPVASDE
jgi:ParB-like nuclease domain